MDKISNLIKCFNCTNVLDSPVLLPCGHSICKKHTINYHGRILCHTCELEHSIPDGGGFPENKALAGIIDSKIYDFYLGDEYKAAKKSCQHFEELLSRIENILNDPYNYAYEEIDNLKNLIQTKCEEMILGINQKLEEIIHKLDKYKGDFKANFSTEEYLAKSASLELTKETSRKELEKWLETLNDFSVSKDEWKRTANESKIGIRGLESELNKFKNDLLPQNYNDFRAEIEKEFGKFEISLAHNLRLNLRDHIFLVKFKKIIKNLNF